MNDRTPLPLHLGVDLHNRVPLGEGHPVFRWLRNLILGDQNEGIRRKSMEWRQDLWISSDQAGSGFSSGWDGGMSPQTGTMPAGLTGARQPLCLWLPAFGGTSVDNYTVGGRSFVTIVGCASGGHLLHAGDANSSPSVLAPVYVRIPAHTRRPQSVNWRGALWVACGDAVPNPTAAALGSAFVTQPTGLVRLGRYTNAQGLRVMAAFEGMSVDLSIGHQNMFTTATTAQACRTFRPKVIGTYRGRMVVANFPEDQYGMSRVNGALFSDFLPGTRVVSATFPSIDNVDVPRFASNGLDPWDGGGDSSAARSFLIGDDGEEIIGMKELSLQQSGAMNQSALVWFKDRSIWLQTGEPLETADLGAVQGDSAFHRQPINDGCPSFETVCETPWGLIWAGHEDVYFMPNGGGAPVPIGRRVASRLQNTPFDMKWRWHAAFHEGHYRLSIMAPGQKQDEPVAMQEEWRLDLRYGPPADWAQARWFGPQVFMPMTKPGTADAVDCGLYITAKEQRTGMKPELVALALGFSPEADRHTVVLAGLDGEDSYDYTCKFSPNQYRPVSAPDSLSLNEKRVITAANWVHGREPKVTVAGTSGDNEPAWVDDFATNVTDNAVTWAPGARVAVPGNFVTRDISDGEDAIPASRGNEVLVMLKTMEMGASEVNKDITLRGVEVGASARDSMTWALQSLADELHAGSLLEAKSVSGNFILGRAALGTRLNDPMAPFVKYVDLTGSGGLLPGKHVRFSLAEYPYITVSDADLAFSFYFDANNDNTPELLVGATLDVSGGYGFSSLKTLLDAVVAAMNASLTAGGLGGTFTHNLTTNPGTCPVVPTITHSTREWKPNSLTVSFVGFTASESPSLWLQLGFTAIGPGVAPGHFPYQTVHTAPHSPWQRKTPKLRITNVVMTTRSFRRKPT